VCVFVCVHVSVGAAFEKLVPTFLFSFVTKKRFRDKILAGGGGGRLRARNTN
jgi:hypothetical protein